MSKFVPLMLAINTQIAITWFNFHIHHEPQSGEVEANGTYCNPAISHSIWHAHPRGVNIKTISSVRNIIKSYMSVNKIIFIKEWLPCL